MEIAELIHHPERLDRDTLYELRSLLALLLVSLIIGTVGAPDTRGKSLEEITRERYGNDY